MIKETEVHSTNSESNQIDNNQGVMFMIISKHAGYEAGTDTKTWGNPSRTRYVGNMKNRQEHTKKMSLFSRTRTLEC